ncbi:AraC family transcriptional regulator [Planotetraspora sp. A-T 1434]|uniref:AraC family transcriptional regulator n=1 Tax=Planotetraspora sp. A-T 1434 TaxID=2979219 RepID=UPI0021BEA6F1|nr:AraC family transcriptional regulator [Planotetraspora sp. A-T 1434]MCT9931796.1 AraC family transcriptional regulator [Planotetraspora sp. A-T 1434]
MRHLNELRSRIARLAAGSPRPSWIEGMTVFSAERVTEPLGTVAEPMLSLVAQGAKRSVLGDRIFDYNAGQYLVVTVDLPLTSQITHATPTEPFLAFGLPLEPALIAQLLVEAGRFVARPHDGPGIATSEADERLLDAVVRLLRLLDEPRDVPVLAPGVRREIHWRLLNGPQAALVRQIGLADSQLTLVARAIEWIKTHYDQVIRIDDLAHDVGISVSSLNRHFRAVTAMSPLQYQKQLRLQKARLRLITAPHDVAAIGHAVGYDSPSQFSREYKRMFGAPPGQDAARLQTVATVQE